MLKNLRVIFSKEEKRKLLFLSIGSVFLSLSETISIGIMIPITGLFISQDKMQSSLTIRRFQEFVGIRDKTSFLAFLIVVAILLFMAKSAYSAFMLYKQQSFIGNVDIRIKTLVLGSYLGKPYSFHLENNSSMLFKNINAEVSQFISGVLVPLISLTSEAIILAGIFLLLVFSYPLITLTLIFVFGSLFTSLNYFLKKRINSYSLQREIYCEQSYKSALEALNAVKEIQAYNVEKYFTGKFAEAIKKYTRNYVKFSLASGIPRYLLETTLFTLVLSSLLISLYFKKTPSDLIPVMTVMGVASLRVMPSINRIYQSISLFQFSHNSLNTVCKLLEEISIPQKEKASKEYPPIPLNDKETIRVEMLNFRHTSAAVPIFDCLSLTIPLNSTVAFVGASGAGKSTLIDILMGLLVPSSGKLYYGECLLNQENTAEYRSKIGYVPQQICLVDDTIKANVAFGVPNDDIDHARLEQVIRISQLAEFLEQLPAGVETRVGERGVKLSGGQKQRIGIARALYRNPEILILDEATSALDGLKEYEITQAVKKMGGSMTIIIVAHRLSTIAHADIVYLMDQGRIIARGTYQELLKTPHFQKIARKGEFTEK